jgi:hypothetical protein
MRIIANLADRLLSAVVPEITAGACCSDNGKTYYVKCDLCKEKGVGLEKKCVVNCYCHAICGPCNIDYPDSNCL